METLLATPELEVPCRGPGALQGSGRRDLRAAGSSAIEAALPNVSFKQTQILLSGWEVNLRCVFSVPVWGVAVWLSAYPKNLSS